MFLQRGGCIDPQNHAPVAGFRYESRMTCLDDWLGPLIQPPKSLARPILVLCRTDASLQMVRAWVARHGGQTGFEVATPRMLAAQLAGPRLGASEDLDESLPAHPLVDRIRDRPGLLALARLHTQELRRARAVQPGLAAPDWLITLADSGWCREDGESIELLELARAHGCELTASLRWSRVVPIGFGVPCEPWTRAIGELLSGQRFSEHHEGRLPDLSLSVTDPVAEARMAVRYASDHPHETLILVQHDATATRIHRALQRNGVPSAWRGSLRLERHSLASVIRRCVPWFAGASDPSIRAVDLHEVLRHPLIAQALPPPAETWLSERLAALGVPDEPHALSPRDVTVAIKRCRHLDAPLSRWLGESEALMARDDEAGLPVHMAKLYARLGVLAAAVRGEPFQDVFGNEAPEEELDWGEFDALISSLVGDQQLDIIEPPAPAGTLGALRRFLLACRVRTRDDPAALRILGALRDGAHRPATRADALQVLIGTVQRSICAQGVEIVHYEDYDGRPSRQLILTDVHDQGIAARPRPDPLLKPHELAALGRLEPRLQVGFRLDQLQRAAAQAEHAVALVSRHDTMGRVVVPPIELRLELESADIGPYGLTATGLPEIDALEGLVVTGATGHPPPDSPLGRAARQATAEWYRAGRGPLGAPPRAQDVPGRDTLAHLLAKRPTPPDWLGPWLGVEPDVEQARLPDDERSVTRFFEPLSHCLYQAFVRNVLRIGEPDTLSAELDAKEIGNAVHDALEHAIAQGGWNHGGEQEAVVARFREALSTRNAEAFERARSTFGALSPSRASATHGLEARWSTHWAAWAANRTRPHDRGDTDETLKLLLNDHLALDRTERLLRQAGRAAGLPELNRFTPKDWILWICTRDLDDQAMPVDELLCSGGRNPLPRAWEQVARDFLQHRALRQTAAALRSLDRIRAALSQPLLGAVAELRFGEKAEPVTLYFGETQEPANIGPLTLQLGDEPVRMRGAIDRILLVGLPNEPLLRIGDYKSGKNAPSLKDGLRSLLDLRRPQLVVYALVLRQAVAEGVLPAPFANSTVATVGWDHLRATRLVREQLVLSDPLDRYLLDGITLDLLGRALGALVKRARSGDWLLSPRADTCPRLKSWGHDHCPYADACRFRANPLSGAR